MAQPAQSKLEFFEQFIETSRHVIREAMPEMAPTQADDLASRIMAAFIGAWGGAQIYIPRGSYLAKLRRDREIFQRFAGGEMEANKLAIEFGVSVNQVYRSCREQRAQRREAIA